MKEEQYEIIKLDSMLESYQGDISLRINRYEATKERLLGKESKISSFANGHLYYGFFRIKDGWIYREWAPNASEIHLIGDFNKWDRLAHPMKRIENGNWEIFVPDKDGLKHGERVKIQIRTKWSVFDRIPSYCKRVYQDPVSYEFYGQVWCPDQSFSWTDVGYTNRKHGHPLVYECHIGMSGEKGGISTFREFKDNVLPRIANLGYNTIQMMAIMEHPYYASFGYQVTNFFAVSSRFGTPEELKELINEAHKEGISVLLDIVHSHASANTAEGLAEFDGTDFQYFHQGGKGNHSAWGTKCFNYGKDEVIHFLLSNIKFWLEEYHFDGFRFDGVTSMLYLHHGLGVNFDHYSKYFSMATDVEAITYLQLAAELTKEINPNAILIAEDMSGMPGMCLPVASGGIGFDYRLAMGLPDFWIQTLRDCRDEDWDLGRMWHELTQHRPMEKRISYCESHDQALVGDKTIMFWLADKEMYWCMEKGSQNLVIDRAVALHKMIRLVTLACGGDGYLTFMGNEFGHPEWIDFPREGNGWSYHYARRQWSLTDNLDLRYSDLLAFDKGMIELAKRGNLLGEEATLVWHHQDDKLLGFSKGDYLFLFNFHPTENKEIEIPEAWHCSELDFSSDWHEFGGFREKNHEAVFRTGKNKKMYWDIRSRSVDVLKKEDDQEKKNKKSYTNEDVNFSKRFK